MHRDQVCCFTGHRIIPKNLYKEIQKRLEEEIVKLIHQGVTYYGVGGAIGFDTMSAMTVLRLRDEYTHIRLILVLPCKDQIIGWSEKNIKIYNQIREQADKVVYTSECYYRGCMHKRNRYLVDNSGCCICYLNRNNGGTKYTVDYAVKKELRIIDLNPEFNSSA